MRVPIPTTLADLEFTAPSALDYFAALVAEDDGLPMLEAAIAVASDEYPQLDVQGVIDEVDRLADRLCQRVAADAAPLQRLRLLNHYFFEELGFAGNVNDYYSAGNSYLPEVLRTRRGIPITLALLYLEMAAQVGLVASGVSFPGHFLVKLRMPRGDVIIDPFSGQSLSREDILEKLQPLRRRHGLHDDDDVPLALLLQTAPAREVVARLLRNLKGIHRTAGDWPRLLAVQQRLVILLPEDWMERRDRGLALAEMGQEEAARADIGEYLRHCPDAADAPELRQRWSVDTGRAASRRRLH